VYRSHKRGIVAQGIAEDFGDAELDAMLGHDAEPKPKHRSDLGWSLGFDGVPELFTTEYLLLGDAQLATHLDDRAHTVPMLSHDLFDPHRPHVVHKLFVGLPCP
jgi:hypothetical protein